MIYRIVIIGFKSGKQWPIVRYSKRTTLWRTSSSDYKGRPAVKEPEAKYDQSNNNNTQLFDLHRLYSPFYFKIANIESLYSFIGTTEENSSPLPYLVTIFMFVLSNSARLAKVVVFFLYLMYPFNCLLNFHERNTI